MFNSIEIGRHQARRGCLYFRSLRARLYVLSDTSTCWCVILNIYISPIDHVRGLNDVWEQGTLYCSEITRLLLFRRFPGLNRERPVVVCSW